MIRRREFITLLGGAAAWPLAARAQQPARMRRIGILMMYGETDLQGQAFVASFLEALKRLGWLENHNLSIDYRWATAEKGLIGRFAKELTAQNLEVILSSSTPTTAALLQQTRTLPIVFANVVDPIGSGFVTSLARPGGNVTGFLNYEFSMGGKWLELLKEIAPRVTRVAAIFNPTAAPYAENYLSHFKSAAQSIGVEGTSAAIGDMTEFESVVAALMRQSDGGFVVVPDGFMVAHHAEIASLAARYRAPAAYFFRGFPEVGGLLSYGNDIVDNYRRAANYVDRILKGAKPSELPVQAPTKYELVINLKTAKALGLDVPWMMQQRADEVIE